MDRIWTSVLCLGVVYFSVPGSTQSSSRTWFLVSAPDVLWAGTPTSLAVTVVSDLPGQVMAELAQGNVKVNQTLSFQGGLTTILALPPISGSVAQNSLFTLTVRGYRNGTLVFTNVTTLSFSLKNVSSFIQTDRSRYRPGDAVRIRSVSVRLDNRPFRGRVNLAVQDPSGNVVHSQDSTVVLGIALQEFNLSQSSPLGLWTITTTVNGVTDKKTFAVEHYARPLFDVLVKTPAQVLVGNDIRGSVRALYPSGQAVPATLAASVALTSAGSPVVGSQTVTIYGSGEFFFSRDQLRDLYAFSKSSNSSRLRVTASVTNKNSNNSTGFTVNKTVEVQLRQNIFLLTFRDFSPTLKPSLNFSAKLGICRYDTQPLTSQDRMYPALVEVTQRRPNMSAESKTLTLQVPEDGNVPIAFKLQDQVEVLLIQARFQSVEETLTIYNNESSPSGSYIQISPNNSLPAQIGFPVQINAKSTFDTAALHFVVSSRGGVVDAGTWSSLSFSLTPTVSWSPEACLTVYCILPSGEVVSDTARILIDQQNYASLNWSGTEAQPGERVSLSVSTLEPRSQVGIVIMGMRDKAPQDEQGSRAKQKCSMRTLTNAALYTKAPADGPKNESLMAETCWGPWTDMAESLLWLDANISDGTWTCGNITVPDGVTSLRAAGLVVSENLGVGFTPVPRTLTVSRDFSLALNLPSHLVRGEEIVLEVNVINHLEKEIEVIVLLSQTKAFQFVLETRGNVSVINAQKLNVGGLRSVAALFPIRALALGEMEVSVDAVSAKASDSLAQRAFVKPAGVEQFYSKTLFLELNQEMHATYKAVSLSFPSNVVPGSQRVEAAVVGDILGLSISNLDSLVQLPLGCGEQNMIHFAPSIYVLQYLDKSTLDSVEIRSRALTFLAEGYVRQLTYQRADGSFSAFGANDTSGSTWLTAFVVRCFLQARTYISVDESVLTGAMYWLLRRQGPQGEFREAGRLIHTEMQGGLDGGLVALTAYVLIALLEDETFVDTYSGNVSLAQKYLEDKVAGGAVSNYSLCLAAYALALANSPVAADALAELHARADLADDVMTWTSSAGPGPGDWRVRSAQVEMASYVLLALFRRGSLMEGIAQLKWLSKQRNHLGGYGTTQDTAVALQALAYYAAFSGANAIDLKLNISSPMSPLVSQFSINSTNYRTYQRKEISADRDVSLDIYMEGRGFAIFQLNAFYSLGGDALSQSQAADKEAFSLDVSVTDAGDRMLVAICTRLKDSQVIPHTGMAILDVGMLSGFSLSPGAVAQTDPIRKVETLPDKVILYLESVNKTDFCIRLQMVTAYKIAHLQEAVVRVYDYYEPTRRATRTYKSDALSKTEACLFCGENCSRCRAGITMVKSNSVGSLTCSFSSLFLGITAYLLMLK